MKKSFFFQSTPAIGWAQSTSMDLDKIAQKSYHFRITEASSNQKKLQTSYSLMFKAPIWSAIICQRQIVVYGKQDNLDNFILRLKVRLNFFLGISIFNFPIAGAKSK